MTSVLVVLCMVVNVYLAYMVIKLHRNVEDLNTLMIHLIQQGDIFENG